MVSESYLDSDELAVFLKAVNKVGLDLDRERFYLLSFSGMRPGELNALQKQDLDFDINTIRISKTLYNETNNMRDYVLEPTKTYKIRIIDMDESIMKMLKRLVHKNDVHKMKYRNLLEEYHDEDFLFQRDNGYPFVVKNINERLKRILKHTDINKQITSHSFRHTHISLLTESGVDLPTIMQRVGHEDSDTTLKVYTHVTNKMKAKANKNVRAHHKNLIELIK